jgi:D-amino-acid dehydrogenase
MRIVIIGSGLIGVSTAYFLAKRGHDVTVLDREEGPGRGASFANGALLTPSMAEPWNAPGSVRVLLSSLFRSDAAIQLRLHAVPSLMGWGIRFLRNSSTEAFKRNSLSNLRLAQYSLEVLRSLLNEAHIDYDRSALGSLRIFRTPAALEHARARAAALLAEGVPVRELTSKEAVDLEPTLQPIATQIAGAIHYGGDEAGDAHRFCLSLTEHARQLGVKFCFGHEVDALKLVSGRVVATVSRGELFVADQYIVAAGSYSTRILRRSGVDLPVRPVKGYSVTLSCEQSPHPLRIPIIDDELHAVIVPIGGAIRVAGTAELAGYDHGVNPVRIQNLLRLVNRVFPSAQFDLEATRPWSGLRAMSADGVPLVGATSIDNLFLNTGHGHLGWTMAAGSAQLLAHLSCGEAPSIDPSPYDPKRM